MAGAFGGNFNVSYMTTIEQQGDGSWLVTKAQTAADFFLEQSVSDFAQFNIADFSDGDANTCTEVGDSVSGLISTIGFTQYGWKVFGPGDNEEDSPLVGLTTNGGDPVLDQYGDGSSTTLYVASQVDRFEVGDTVTFNTSGTWTYCFAAGTAIAIPKGETAVETLQIGDLVTTADGRAVPVKWIGHQTVHRMFAGDRARPVRVAAGALGDDLPHSDLILTADHALIIDGLAINAGALVNGTTISRDPAPERATYYHIESDAHDVILANGAAAETFIDYAGRQAFDNYADYLSLYGDNAAITEMHCPRISSQRHLPPYLAARFGIKQVA